MAYRKPFTPEQRREAIRTYRSFRKHLSLLRREYPPSGAAQIAALKAYRDSIRRIGDLLQKPDRSVDVVALTHADASARWLAMEYWRFCSR